MGIEWVDLLNLSQPFPPARISGLSHETRNSKNCQSQARLRLSESEGVATSIAADTLPEPGICCRSIVLGAAIIHILEQSPGYG